MNNDKPKIPKDFLDASGGLCQNFRRHLVELIEEHVEGDDNKAHAFFSVIMGLFCSTVALCVKKEGVPAVMEVLIEKINKAYVLDKMTEQELSELTERLYGRDS